MAHIPDGMIVIMHAGALEMNDGKQQLPVTYEDKELVMCKHCIHWAGPDDGQWHTCGLDQILRPADWFCAGGELPENR